MNAFNSFSKRLRYLQFIMFLLLVQILIYPVKQIHLNNLNYHENVQISPSLLYHDQKSIQSKIDYIIHQVQNYYQKQKFEKSKIKFEKQSCKQYHFLHIYSQNLKSQSIKQQKPLDIILTCNIHARQLLASQICLKFIEKLSKIVLNPGNYSNQTYLISPYTQYRIFYIANTQRQNALKKDHCIRKNQNGVDLNRNFPTQFNSYNQSKNSSIYSGPYPFSQDLPQCIQKAVQKQLPDFYLDIHTGQIAIYYQVPRPYNESLDNQLAIIQPIVNKDNHLCPQCRVTTLQKDGQFINGHIFADLKVRKKLKYSILIEAYGLNQKEINTKSQNERCYLIFNPSTQKTKQKYQKKWVASISKMIQEIQKRQNKKI